MHDKYYIGKPGHTGWILPYTVYVAGLRLAGKINQLLESPKLGIQVPRARYTFQYLLGPHFKTPENPSNIFAEKSNICTTACHIDNDAVWQWLNFVHWTARSTTTLTWHNEYSSGRQYAYNIKTLIKHYNVIKDAGKTTMSTTKKTSVNVSGTIAYIQTAVRSRQLYSQSLSVGPWINRCEDDDANCRLGQVRVHVF